MPRSGTESRRYTEQVLVRLPPDMKEAISALAAQRGVTEATWCRQQLRELVDCADLPPIREYKARKPSRAREADHVERYIAEVGQLRELLGEIGGSLRQSIGLAQGGRGDGFSARVEAVLPGVKLAAAEAQALKDKILADLGS